MAVKTVLTKCFWSIALLTIVSCGIKKNSRQVDEQYTLGSNDTNPFGAAVSRSLTEKIFPGQPIVSNRKTFDAWEQKKQQPSVLSDQHVYFIVSPSVMAWEKEVQAMKQFIERGNTLVLATDKINEILSEQFSLRIMNDATELPFMPQIPMRDTWLQLNDSSIFTSKQFSYFYEPMSYRLSASTQYQSVVVLALNESGRPSALRIRMGRGQLIVVTNARSFSNYFLLNQNNVQFLLGLYAYLPAYPATLTWDDFYCRNLNRQPEGYSVFSALLAIPPLRWAFWILILLGLLWVVSNLRRKQKMIPVIAPNTNATVSFVNTIAQLYYNKADHANIARKIAAHFTDQLRNRYYLPPNIRPDDWPAILGHKTSLDQFEATAMAQFMQKALEEGGEFSAQELLEFHLLANKALPPKRKVPNKAAAPA